MKWHIFALHSVFIVVAVAVEHLISIFFAQFFLLTFENKLKKKSLIKIIPLNMQNERDQICDTKFRDYFALMKFF